MDARFIEDFLEVKLKQLFKKSLTILRGPPAISKLSGIRPEVYLHAVRLEDFNGKTLDGAQIARYPVKGKPAFKGVAEERPGRLILVVTCTTGSYDLLQEIFSQLAPAVLLALELLPRIPLGSLFNKSAQLHFDDFTPCLHTSELDRVSRDDFSFFNGRLEFHLNGFIHVLLTNRGGLTKPDKPTRPVNPLKPKKKIAIKKTPVKSKPKRAVKKKTPVPRRKKI